MARVGRQVGLLLWRDFLYRKRKPLMTFLELGWPIFIFFVVIAVRQGSLPDQHGSCQYKPLVLPSSGGLEFLQSFLCNLDNNCRRNNESFRSNGIVDDPRQENMRSSMQDLLVSASGDITNYLPRSSALMDSIGTTMTEPEMQAMAHNELRVADFFHGISSVTLYMTQHPGVLEMSDLLEIMQSKINIHALPNVIDQYYDFKYLICHPENLENYLTLTTDVSIEEVSQVLCDLSHDAIPELVSFLQRNVNVKSIVNRVESLLNKTPYSGLADIENPAAVIDLLLQFSKVVDLDVDFPELSNLVGWVQGASSVANRLETRLHEVPPVMDILRNPSSNLTQFYRMSGLADVTDDGIQSLMDLGMIVNQFQKQPEPEQVAAFHEFYESIDELAVTLHTVYNLTAIQVNRLLTMEIGLPRLLILNGFLLNATSAKQHRSFMCVYPGVSSIFVPTAPEEKRFIEILQNKSCELNITLTGYPFTYGENIQTFMGATVSPFNMTNAMSLEAVSAMSRDSGNAGTTFNDFVPFLEQIGSTLEGPSVRATPYGGEWALVNVLEGLHRVAQSFPGLKDMDEVLQLILYRDSFELPVPLPSEPSNDTMIALFHDLLLDSTSTANFMVRTLRIPPAAVNALLESFVNVNMLARVVGTQLTLQDIFCDVTLLGQFLVQFNRDLAFPLSMDVPTLSRQLCGNIDDVSARALAQSINLGSILESQVVDRIPEYLLDEKWWEPKVQFVDVVGDGVGAALHAVTMVNEIIGGNWGGAISDLATAIGMAFRNVPGLEDIGGLVESVGGILSIGTPFTTILNDVGLVSNAILSMGQQQPSLLFEGAAIEFMDDPAAVKSYFGEVLKIPPRVSDAILRANFSYSKVLTPEDLGSMAGFGCTLDGLVHIIQGGSVNNSIGHVLRKLCDMEVNDAVDFGVAVVPDLDLGPYIKHYFDLSPSYLLDKANLTSNDLRQMADLLVPLHTQAMELGEIIKASYPDAPSMQSDSEDDEEAGPAWNTSSVSKIFCNNGALDAVASGSDFLSLLESELDYSFQLTDGHRAEMNELETEFCRDAYLSIQKLGYRGSMIWHALKPLFRGQILYSPDNEVTAEIMSALKSFVDSVHDIRRVTGAWLQSVNSLTKLSNTVPPADMDALLDTLSSDIISDAMDQLFGQSGKVLVDMWRNSEGLNFTSDELANMKVTTEAIHNITGCFDIRVYAAKDEEALMEQGKIFQAENRLLAGIVFVNVDGSSSRQRRDAGGSTKDFNTHIKYKIRMDSANVRRSNRLRDYIAAPGPEADFFDKLRYIRGFIPLQDMVERGIIRHLTNDNGTYPDISLQQMPYPCWQDDDFLKFGSFIVAILLVFSWLCIYAMSIAVYVAERENQVAQTMQVMGLSSTASFLAWFLRTTLSMVLMSVLATCAIVFGQMMIYSDATVVFVLLLCYSLAVTMLAYLISMFFKKTTVAVLVGVLWYLISIMPYILIYNAEYVADVAVWKKVLMCLSATAAFTQTAIEGMYAEQQSHGLQWDTVHATVATNFPPLYGAIMMLVDAFIYGVLAWFFYNVFYGPHGSGQPVYFLFTKEYWGYNKKKSIHYTDFGRRRGNDDDSIPGEPEPESLPIGITLRGLTKTYKNQPRPAVNGINVNFFQGQVTAFLGHNGAGKTSTINMLTGNSRPSSGLAFINGRDVKTDMSEIRRDMGMCPQYDILCGYMTVEEHLDFYACMKGRHNKKERKAEIKRMLTSTGLYPMRQARADHLSGGQRRRLSIGVAFIGGSKTILLDEPTSGVDPAARRSIWDVITKNRDGRTILLSTHHLDEAEIIGDRILVIHRGKVLCMGSPMFLKRYFGSGYHLTVAKTVCQRDDVSNNTLKEKSLCRSEDVLAFIQEHVPNARLVEEIGTEVTFVLPPGKRRSEAMRNLFRRLEEQQESLHIHKYGVSDTPLEEIFLKVTTLAEQGQALDPKKLRQFSHPDDRRQSTDSISGGGSLLGHYDENSDSASELGSLRGYRQRSAYYDGSSIDRSSQVSRTDRTGSRDLDHGIPSINSSSRLPSYRSGSRRDSQTDSQSITSSGSSSSGYRVNGSQESLIHSRRTVSSGTTTKKSSPTATPPNGSLCQEPRTYDGGVAGELRSDVQYTGRKLAVRQFRALLTKRFLHNVRNPRNYFSQLLLPAIFVCAAMLGSVVRPRPTIQEPNYMVPTLYSPNAAHVLRIDHPSPLAADMVSTLTKLGVSTACMADADDGLGAPCIRNRSSSLTYKLITEEEAMAIASEPECNCDKGYQQCPMGAEGVPAPYITTREDDLLFDITNHSEGMEEYILRSHQEFTGLTTRPRGGRNGGWTFDVYEGNTTARVWFNNKAFHAMPAYLNGLNNMILRANVPPNQRHKYGITLISEPFPILLNNLNIEYIYQGISDSGVVLILMAALCFLPPSFTTYLVLERAGKQKRLQHICGVSAFLYWCTAFLWDMLTYLFMTGILVGIVISFQVPLYVDRQNLPAFLLLVILFGWATTPMMYLLSKFFKDASQSYMVLFLFNMFIGLNSTATTFYFSLPIFSNRKSIVLMRDILTNMFLITPQYCLGDGLLRLARNQFVFGVFKTFKLDTYQNPFSPNMLFWHYVTMIVEGCLFFALVLLIETKVMCKRSPSKMKQSPDHMEDSDVSLERQRVVTGEAENEALVLYNLTKVYRRGLQKVRAVDHTCLGIQKGECFGLLGINGAGKTTTFKMITGDLNPSAGAALMKGHIISEDSADMQQEVGYCPQMDSLDPMLTGQETLEFFCRLKGMPEEEIKPVVDAAIRKFNLGDHRKKKSAAYSAGNKRKLSAAIALLGEPQIVLMDEPTTGMDPGTRRLVWDNVLSVVKDNRSVILTSHSMAECDALCTRMAIMVNGSFMCLGNSQHLKDKFGSGYTTIVRVGGDPPNISGVISFMQSTFPGSVVKDRHLRQLEFAVPPRGCQLSSLFGAMEDQKRKGLVEDYTVSQTTLDQVFLHFARQQDDSRMDDMPEGGMDDGDKVSIISGSHMSSLLSVVSKHKELRSRKLGSNLTLPVTMEDGNTITTSNFNLERWAYNIPPKFLHDIKSGPKTGKAAKEHLQNVLSMNLPSEAKHLPPMRLAQYLGPEVCKTMREKTKKYRHGKQKRDRSSAPSTEPTATPETSVAPSIVPSVAPSIAPSVTPSDLPSVAPSDSISVSAIRAAIREAENEEGSNRNNDEALLM